jgi:hypothetical protein
MFLLVQAENFYFLGLEGAFMRLAYGKLQCYGIGLYIAVTLVVASVEK